MSCVNTSFVHHLPRYDEEDCLNYLQVPEVITGGTALYIPPRSGKTATRLRDSTTVEAFYIMMSSTRNTKSAELDRLRRSPEIVRSHDLRLDNVKRKKRTPRQPLKRAPEPRIESGQAQTVRVVKEAPAEKGPEEGLPAEKSEGEQGELK